MAYTLATLKPKLDGIGITRVRVITLVLVAVPIAALTVAVFLVPPTLTRPTGPGEFWMLVAGAAAVATLAVTLGVGAVAWFGLRSLRLARQDMETRATREARSLAILRAEQFSALIKGEQQMIQRELAAAEVASFTHNVRSGAAIFDDPVMYPPAKAWWDSVPVKTQERIIFFLNDLEAWAMYFTQALAESEVVYGPCAPTYCSLTMQYAPWIIIVRREQFSGFYPNILTLFQAWRAELDAQEGGKRTEAALRAAQAAEERRLQHRVPPPLGTKVDL